MASGLHVCEIIVFDDRVGCNDDNNSDRPLAVRRSGSGVRIGQNFGGYTGRHLPPSPAVQAVTTRTSTRGGEKSRTSVEHINTNDLGLEC